MNQINITKIKEELLEELRPYPTSKHIHKPLDEVLALFETSILKILDSIDVEFRGESPTGYNQKTKEIKDIITKLKL